MKLYNPKLPMCLPLKLNCSTSKCVDFTHSLSASFLLYCMCRTASVKISALLYVKWDNFCIAT